MIPDYIQGTCPNGGTPVMKNISGMLLAGNILHDSHKCTVGIRCFAPL